MTVAEGLTHAGRQCRRWPHCAVPWKSSMPPWAGWVIASITGSTVLALAVAQRFRAPML
jgi:hypothetical protein